MSGSRRRSPVPDSYAFDGSARIGTCFFRSAGTSPVARKGGKMLVWILAVVAAALVGWLGLDARFGQNAPR